MIYRPIIELSMTTPDYCLDTASITRVMAIKARDPLIMAHREL